MGNSVSGHVIDDKGLETPVIILECNDLRVSIAPKLGSNMFEFTRGDQQIIYCNKALLKDRDWTGCFVLWPFPNRVKNKEYEFEGKTYSLKNIKRKQGNYPLVHGLVDDQEWQYQEPQVNNDNVSVVTFIEITSQSPLFAYYPFESKLSLTYTLHSDAIHIQYDIENKSTKTIPFGFALHPYFSTQSGTTVCLPTNTVMKTDSELLPTGELQRVVNTEFDLTHPRPVQELVLDHVFTDIQPQQNAYIINAEYKLSAIASADCTHLVLYTLEKDKGFICLENQTGSTDMINLHDRAVKEKNEVLKKAAHLLTLPPHQTHTGFIEYRLEFMHSAG